MDERTRDLAGRTTGIAVLAILAMHDPVGSFAQANSRAVIKVFYITDRQHARPPLTFSNSPGADSALSYGTAVVLAPMTQLATMSMAYPVRRGKPASYEVAGGSITEMSEATFFDDVKSLVHSSSAANQEFVFVPGFATPFTNSLLRIAQLANDLKFKGAPIVFSWPSGNIYTVDKENAFWAAKHLAQSVSELKRRTNPERMHLVAHSMGSLVLGSAMDGLAVGKGAIENVVFAAPDVNEALFSRFAEAARLVAKRITVYVSRSDGALLASDIIQDDRVGSRVVPRPGIEVIDAADVDRPISFWGLLGHSYIFDSDKVLLDLAALIDDSRPADQRVGTAPAGPPGCWRLERRRPS